MTQLTLPPELALLTQIVDAEPPDVQELFQYALTMLPIENGKAQVAERHKIDCREWLTVLSVGAELPQGHRQAGCERRTAGAVTGDGKGSAGRGPGGRPPRLAWNVQASV